MKRYGLPYMGSKNTIAEKVVSYLPPAEHFYDLFCGGCAITHCAMIMGRYKYYHINDLNAIPIDLFMKAVEGRICDKPRWVSKEEFHRDKLTDSYTAFMFSFGTNLIGYAYNKDTENNKRALFYAIVDDKWDEVEKYLPEQREGLQEVLRGVEGWRIRRMKVKAFFRSIDGYDELIRLQSLDSLESLESLERLERLERLESSSKNYNEVEIKDNSVIYCDIPYKGTGEYKQVKTFNYDAFYDWCGKQTQPLFISEYNMPEDRFVCIAEFVKRCTLSATNNNKKTIERLFIPKHQENLFEKPTLF